MYTFREIYQPKLGEVSKVRKWWAIWDTGAVSTRPRNVKQSVWLMDCKNIAALGMQGTGER